MKDFYPKIFEKQVKIKIDIFHAIKRFTETFPRNVGMEWKEYTPEPAWPMGLADKRLESQH